MNRDLDWDGCHNVRDLGGLGDIRPGALVRADSLDKLTAKGWRQAHAYGIRTVIDLRNEDEYGTDTAPRPDGITTLRVPIDGIEDREFWDKWWGGWEYGTPVYYRPFLAHFPERVAVVVTALVEAGEGGIAFHCAAGRDRTGLMALVVLAALGVEPEATAADYALGYARAQVESADCDAGLAERGLTPHSAALEVLDWFKAEDYLRVAGITDEQLTALRLRARTAQTSTST
ncbi:tyrosine-protein phosphatase [Streptomyces sp. NBC_01304]|uniref:tyrosine-protein phosphatase n=1 Tax=Streptomyces sp. NBC_01304 TaxID=2903818 RepID=UPI002E149FA4|nr:tyrosine-protein phosphatase [Streptomyces sp. NBC_01304]